MDGIEIEIKDYYVMLNLHKAILENGIIGET